MAHNNTAGLVPAVSDNSAPASSGVLFFPNDKLIDEFTLPNQCTMTLAVGFIHQFSN